MRLLVFGGWGQLGSELVSIAEGRHSLIRPTHGEADVTDPDATARAVTQAGPDAVVNMAAFHQMERCESDPGAALAVNAVGAWNVARAAREAGARCVYVSTDYVFGGEDPTGYAEDAVIAPVNAYGVSKAAGERLARLACPDTLVMRGSSLFGHAGSSGKGGNFVETILAKGAGGEGLSVVDDVVMSPTAARDMAERMLFLLEREGPAGTYHLANEGRCSWFAFAKAILDLAGVSADLRPRSADGDPIARPRCSVLLDTRSAALGLPAARPWREALEWYVANRPQRVPEADRVP